MCTPSVYRNIPVVLTLVLMLLLNMPVHAQLLTVQNANITIGAGTHVVVRGGLLASTNAVFANQGTLHVTGDWVNNSGGAALTATSTGQILLNGGAQGIDGADVTDFRNLVISGGDKTLLQDAMAGRPLAATGTLDLNGALLFLNGQTFTLYNPASGALIDGGGSIISESTDLLSRFEWALGADVSIHRIPFRNLAGEALPFAFTPGAVFPSNSLLGVATYPTAADNTPFAITANQAVLHVMGTAIADNSPNTVDRFWLVDLPNGMFTGALQLSYTPSDDASMGPGLVRAQRWLESPGTWQPPLSGQSNPGLREVAVPAVPLTNLINPENEHIWAMAYDLTPLPIELVAFNAEAVANRYVHCEWTTASERNNHYFTVERSRDAVAFEPVGNVPGAGNSFGTKHYAFDDPSPYLGTSYYRLRQTDFDGNLSWSVAIPVVITAEQTIRVFPNPNNGSFTIQRSNTTSDMPLQLWDASGRSISEWNMANGSERKSVEMELAPGLYSLAWPTGQVKITVER